MSAFFIATVTVKDEEKFKEYAVKSKATFDQFSAEILARGKYQGVLTGEADHQAVAIVKFKDLDTMNRWYTSDEYQALIPLRDQAADMTITQYVLPPA
ncbi:hypothetical protein MNBD_GAMMA21-1490 [hydrothermal vent metagenome]|uniref:DUF1330 domain-containing protein n=1 Tax=hydrothermal vent metagenome TaxID=652676 RepID=A0A3B1ABH9_9ZZZZ